MNPSLDLSWECVHGASETIFFLVMHMSTNDLKNTMDINFGVENKI